MRQIWAHIQGGVVAELTDVDPMGRFHPDFIWVGVSGEVMIGDSFNDGNFSRPEPSPLPVKTRYTSREFVRRFSMDEQLAIRQAQLADMEVGLVYDDFNRADFIDLEDPAVAAGIDLYVSKGLLLPKRRDELLAPDI
ncbi:hypothetical protein IPU70_15320 [Achromobacter sp. SD115]|uniref:Uncharacterized protein n=1 Tax=Achromobacter xylosoxidans (strain A8) TaxID=762376 RepID=E3HI81_ACHXA|nr:MULTISPECIES: hypothetical protein [Achromobacter]ADP17940.1 hypothetical protein AXYL_04625 [Achromobacter xylosoxidans A8]MBO1014930.1 hypothetical protein [Achromobacter sp. SD115]